MLEAVGLGAHVRQARAPDVGRPAAARRDRARAGRQAGDRAGRRAHRLARQGSGREVVDRMQALAKEQGATILIVTHDNRILDVADRILHLEDGRISTFTEAVIANTQHMMGAAGRERQQGAARAARRADGRGGLPPHARASSRSSRSASSRPRRSRATRRTRACSSRRCGCSRAASASCSTPSAPRCSSSTTRAANWCCASRRTSRPASRCASPRQRHRRRRRRRPAARCASPTRTRIRASTATST